MTSNVIGEIKTVSSKIMWEVDKSCMNCNVGNYVESPRFGDVSGDGIQWFLRLYPKGVANNSTECTHIYLLANRVIKAVGNLKIFNDKDRCVLNYNMKECKYDNYSNYSYKNNGIVISRDFITNPGNGIISGNKIIIACEVTMPAYEKEEINLIEIKEQKIDVLPQLNALLKYEALLNDSEYSDVCLISEGKPLKVHRCILAKSSPVFAAMFDAEMKERQENTVDIVDIKYDVLVEMVRFIYIGKVNNIDTLAGKLATAADKYALEGLKKICEDTMRNNLSPENVVACLQIAERLCMDELKEKTIEFISENENDISEKPEFQLLPYEIVVKVCRGMAKKRKL